MTNKMNIAALNAYHFDEHNPQYQLNYSKLYVEFLKKSLPNILVKEFKVALGQWPNLEDFDGFVISGSPKGAYEDDEWIVKLRDFIKELHRKRKKLVGICFGHQLIAHALGGEAAKSKSGWGVGVKDFNITKLKAWMTPVATECQLLFSHQDQVIKLPENAEHLAKNDFCPVQMFSIGNHIFSMQGHPEFSAEFAKDRLDNRIEAVGSDAYNESVKTLNRTTSSQLIGTWIHNFFSRSEIK